MPTSSRGRVCRSARAAGGKWRIWQPGARQASRFRACLGEREFYGLAFFVTRHTFDPRPDTETLVEAALDAARARWSGGKRLRILELGTGTGAVIISLLAALPAGRRDGRGHLSRMPSPRPRHNARRHGVGERLSLHKGSWFEGLTGRFDVIVANPPYLERRRHLRAPPEVTDHDPVLALDGGSDGLDAYRRIGRSAARFMSAGGLLLLEIGEGQKDAVAALMNGHGLRPPQDLAGTRRDLHGIERVLAFEAPAARRHG